MSTAAFPDRAPREPLADDQRLALERARQLFRFLKAFAERNVPVRRSLREHDWVLSLADLPAHEAIFVGSVTTANADPGDNGGNAAEAQPLLRVVRPRLREAPAPPAPLGEWVEGRWNDPFAEPRLREKLLPAEPTTEPPRIEALRDVPDRGRMLDAWLGQWRVWAEPERPARRAAEVFDRFYALYGRIERESERVELMLGDGRLRHGFGAGADHPILLQRVELQFDPNVPEFRVVDSDRAPELYTAILQEMDGVSGETLNTLRRELEAGGFHPLDDAGTAGFLNRLANSLGSETRYLEGRQAATGGAPTVLRDRSLFLRPRMSGMPAAMDRVLEDLQAEFVLPPSLSRIVGVEPPLPVDEVAGPDVSPWGEPPDVLFSKEANLEQVRIARALERHRAVLVQGPPGTGKSHTIANLIGHLVATGRRVLVTSHTTKALRVLREHIVTPLRPLAVSLLDHDLQGRAELEHAVRGIVSRVGAASESAEARRAGQLTAHREALIAEVERLSSDLRTARTAEYEPVTIQGETLLPAEAARTVRTDSATHEWLPGPIVHGAPVPLTYEQLATLYESNRQLSLDEERELIISLPPLDRVLEPRQFATAVAALATAEPAELTRFWKRAPAEVDAQGLTALAAQLSAITSESQEMAPWQRALASAGRVGEAERGVWAALRELVGQAAAAYERDRVLLLTHDVQMLDGAALAAEADAVSAMREHVQGGGGFGALQLLFHSRWKVVLSAVAVDGRPPQAPEHFAAIAAVLKSNERRAALARRWDKQAAPVGLPTFASISDPPERLLLDYVGQFDRWLRWWDAQWEVLEPALASAGFRWEQFREHHVARSAPTAMFERDVALVAGPLRDAASARLGAVRRAYAERVLSECGRALAGHAGRVALALRRALDARDPAAYAEAYEAMVTVARKSQVWAERRRLLAQLETCAPAWATAIRERRGAHGGTRVPNDVPGAWRWRQLDQELERRARLDEQDVARRLGEARRALRATTVELIDVKAWLAQLRRTDLTARQALMGWSDTQKKIGKGTGKRVPELQAKARELLSKAREAVPVWIMPLARVAESFDPRERKFDVVIVDEASQSDVTALLAFYLGERVVIVGDHEQVSPSAVGQQIETLQALRTQYLVGVPNQHLYDGQTSIYDLARQSFGGTIALREHFRCVPDIIDFSNYLSYDGQVLPLRDPATAPCPHVIEHVVPAMLGGRDTGKVNEGEARMAAAIVAAMCAMPEYEGRTLGVVSLLGDEQALRIQELALTLVDAVALEARRFSAGNPAQFQGDERHVILLSMVDSSTGRVLRMRADEPTKQRYNVAVSRAKDQLWLLHSLDPTRDLQPGDLRRRLIEHVRDPGAMRRTLAGATASAESPFERAVIERLVSRGYHVRPQVEVGHYRLDMVVSSGDAQVALECDGDRYHPVEKIPEDLARQAVLERTGWRFVRLRGTGFYRDPEAAMDRVYSELGRLGVHPNGTAPAPVTSPQSDQGSELRDEVVRRAWKILLDRGWAPAPAADTSPSPMEAAQPSPGAMSGR